MLVSKNSKVYNNEKVDSKLTFEASNIGWSGGHQQCPNEQAHACCMSAGRDVST